MKSSPIRKEEIIKAMKKLKSGKADGIDGITAEILKADTDKATHYLKKKYSQVFGIKTPCHLF